MCVVVFFFFFKQKTAYEMRISDWSSDVCSSDLSGEEASRTAIQNVASRLPRVIGRFTMPPRNTRLKVSAPGAGVRFKSMASRGWEPSQNTLTYRSEEHTSELQSLMRISYAVFCLKKKNTIVQSSGSMHQLQVKINKSNN